MKRLLKPGLLFGAGLAVGLCVGVGMLVGFMVGSNSQEDTQTGKSVLDYFPETALHASATDSGETLTIATGRIDDEVEGLFILDSLTGILQCWVISARYGRWIGNFQYNVLGDVGGEEGKAAPLVMVTGDISTRGGARNAARPADTLVYVANTKTGKVAAYTLPWNQSMAASGALQKGAFKLLDAGTARTIAIRP